MMEAVRTSETSVSNETTRHYSPECHLYNVSCTIRRVFVRSRVRGLDWHVSGQAAVAVSCDCGSGPSVFTRCLGLLD
jgi:hypothetical protein